MLVTASRKRLEMVSNTVDCTIAPSPTNARPEALLAASRHPKAGSCTGLVEPALTVQWSAWPRSGQLADPSNASITSYKRQTQFFPEAVVSRRKAP